MKKENHKTLCSVYRKEGLERLSLSEIKIEIEVRVHYDSIVRICKVLHCTRNESQRAFSFMHAA